MTTDNKDKKEKSVEERFAENVACFVGVLKEILEKTKSSVDIKLIDFAGQFLAAMDKRKLVEYFISSSYKHWDLIKKRDRKYFVKDAQNIFSVVKADHINTFAKLFEEDKNGKIAIDKEDEDSIGDYFDSFVKIAIKYIHINRMPSGVNKKGEFIYTVPCFDEIDLNKEAKKWGVKLSV